MAVVLLGGGLVACDKVKNMTGVNMGGSTDFRNAQIDVSDTPCANDAKFSTLVLKDGKYALGDYQFEMFGDVKHGDVSANTAATKMDDAVFVGNCAIGGQTSQVLFVYGPDGKRLGATNLTDNGKGLVQSFDIGDTTNTITVEQNLGNPPTLSKTSYALLNGKLADTSGAAPAAAVANADAQADDADVDTISYQSFHDKLQPYGRWVNHPRWGMAWHPTAANFRPYENGHWEDSDEYGSVWVSADAWGDAPTHYGRWGYDPNYGGWLWVPGYVWGPSWVVWRADDVNLGWFPIPPGEWDGEGDYPDAWDSWYGYRGVLDEAAFYSLWAFVPAVDIFAGNIRDRIIDRRGYGRFMGRTRAWGHYGLSHGHVVSRAFDHGRFAANFHHGLPGGGRHDFNGHHAGSFAAGRHTAAHERAGGGSHGFSGHGSSGGFHEAGFSHSSGGHGFSHSSGGFSHSGGGMSGHSSSGFSRSGSGHSGGFSHSGGGGFSRSGGGGGFGHSSSGGGGMFGHSNSGGGGFGHSSSGGFGHSSSGSSGHSSAPSNSGGGHHHH
jgi:hypothetical protein